MQNNAPTAREANGAVVKGIGKFRQAAELPSACRAADTSSALARRQKKVKCSRQ